MTQVFTVIREPVQRPAGAESFTPGKLYYNGVKIGETCEDEDRRLEDGGEKVYGRTAISRGRYRLAASWSHRFGKTLPEVLGVPDFAGVRIHGGNRAEDSLGCILVGQVRTATGIAQCASVVQRVLQVLEIAEETGEPVWLEIK